MVKTLLSAVSRILWWASKCLTTASQKGREEKEGRKGGREREGRQAEAAL
jgi:hypothetical protein